VCVCGGGWGVKLPLKGLISGALILLYYPVPLAFPWVSNADAFITFVSARCQAEIKAMNFPNDTERGKN